MEHSFEAGERGSSRGVVHPGKRGQVKVPRVEPVPEHQKEQVELVAVQVLA